MKNVFKLVGIIVIAAAIGFSMVSCSDRCPDSPDGKHDWSYDISSGYQKCNWCDKVKK